MSRKRLIPLAVVSLVLSVGLTAASRADDGDVVTGTGRAIGPDIIQIDTQRVILLGIDAPENDQICQDSGTIWKCGDTAFAVLDQLLNAGPVTCTLYGPPDPFRRRGGVCTVDGKDIAEQMIEQGLALPYPQDKQSAMYLDAEKQAKAAGVGLWKQGVQFENPWDYRRRRHPGGFK